MLNPMTAVFSPSPAPRRFRSTRGIILPTLLFICVLVLLAAGAFDLSLQSFKYSHRNDVRARARTVAESELEYIYFNFEDLLITGKAKVAEDIPESLKSICDTDLTTKSQRKPFALMHRGLDALDPDRTAPKEDWIVIRAITVSQSSIEGIIPDSNGKQGSFSYLNARITVTPGPSSPLYNKISLTFGRRFSYATASIFQYNVFSQGDLEFNPGGMAERCAIWEEHAIPIPDHISFAEGTFLDGLGVAAHAAHRASIFPGDAFAVLGGGPIGLSIMQVAQALGAGPAVVTDVYDAALECARELGAAGAVDARGGDAEALGAELRSHAGGGFGAVFESTGTLEGQLLGLSLLAPGGTMMLMAGAAPGLMLTPGCLAGERTLTTCSNNLYEEYFIGLRLLAEGRVRVAPMITHRFPLDDVERAFEVATQKHETGAVKVVIEG